jgi:hypothetical protein
LEIWAHFYGAAGDIRVFYGSRFWTRGIQPRSQMMHGFLIPIVHSSQDARMENCWTTEVF